MFNPANFNEAEESQELVKNQQKEEDFVPKRPNHERDEALEEFIDSDPNKPTEPNRQLTEQDKMGISEKAKRQSSDEGDRAAGKE